MYTKSYKRILWQRTKVKRDQYEKRYYLIIRAVLNKQFKQLADRIDSTNYQSDALVSNVIERDTIEKMMVSLYKNVGVAFAKDQHRNLKAENQSLLFKQVEDYQDEWEMYMENYAKTKAGLRITSIAESGREQALKIIRTMMDQSTTEGWGADETARAIRKELLTAGQEINQWRALRIARTEIVTASNQGAIAGAKTLDMPTDKFWISTYDSRTRDTHIGMESQNPKDMSEDFDVGGYKMDSPGDPRGGPEETINCRCSIAFQIRNT